MLCELPRPASRAGAVPYTTKAFNQLLSAQSDVMSFHSCDPDAYQARAANYPRPISRRYSRSHAAGMRSLGEYGPGSYRHDRVPACLRATMSQPCRLVGYQNPIASAGLNAGFPSFASLNIHSDSTIVPPTPFGVSK